MGDGYPDARFDDPAVSDDLGRDTVDDLYGTAKPIPALAPEGL